MAELMARRPMLSYNFSFRPTIMNDDWQQTNWRELKQNIIDRIEENRSYYVNFLTADNRSIRINRAPVLTSSSIDQDFIVITGLLDTFLQNPDEYSLSAETDIIRIQLIEVIDENPPLVNQRLGFYNCVAEIILTSLNLQKHATQSKSEKTRILKSIMRVKNFNKDVLEDGVSDANYMELSKISNHEICVSDKRKHIWRSYKHNKKNCKKILIESRNNHNQSVSDNIL